jgi:endonuclease/exonuclease/phosphatase family metal-dependent hydrolase
MPLIALLLALLCGPAWGAELKFATWNLEWLTARPEGDRALPADVRPKSDEDIARLRKYAAVLAADVVALQEVDGPEIAARIFPPDHYHIHITRDSVVQRVAIAIRSSIAFTAHADLTALDVGAEGHGRLRSGADVTLNLPGGHRLRLLAVHLKAGCRQERLGSAARGSCGLLQTQLAPLQGWIAARRDEGVPYMLFGDFNRWMDAGDAFWAGLARTAPLARATEGSYSPCWGGGAFIDHLIAGGPARSWLRPDTLKVLVYRETGEAWKERLSDHCPVSVRLHVPE